jgi:hypothetical protein
MDPWPDGEFSRAVPKSQALGAGLGSVGDVKHGRLFQDPLPQGETLLTWRAYPCSPQSHSVVSTGRFVLARSIPSAGGKLASRVHVGAYPKIDGFRPGHCVFHSGCGLFENCHSSSAVDGKEKGLRPIAEMDRLTPAVPFTRPFRRASGRARTGEAGRSVFDWLGKVRSRNDVVGHR